MLPSVCLKLFLVNIRVGGRDIWRVRGRRKVHIHGRVGRNLRERDNLEGLDVDGRVILR
jgi:hypothetical protein